MDPTGAGRSRGFRAPSPEELATTSGASGAQPFAPQRVTPEPHPPDAPATAGEPVSSSAETMDVGPPRRRRPTSRRWRRPGRRPLLTAAVLLLAVVVIAALAFRLGSHTAGPATTARETPAPTPTTATPLPVPDLYRQVVPSVVLITTSKGSLGSGVIVNDTGTVLTANHVVSGGGSISVLFADGTRTAATVASAVPKNDIATLTPQKLPEVVVPATLGGGVAVGADVVAIGNPLGLRDSTSTGVVSGLSRSTKTRTGPLSGLIQFDAAVNPGSSGGPLLNSLGLVIGVVVSIADPGDDEAFAGIGFAVPIGAALAGGSGPGQGRGPQL